MMGKHQKLKLMPLEKYGGVNRDDPLRFYFHPLFGPAYRRRVELCLEELEGGERVLEVGFGSGLSFLNLRELYRERDPLYREIADVVMDTGRQSVQVLARALLEQLEALWKRSA